MGSTNNKLLSSNNVDPQVRSDLQDKKEQYDQRFAEMEFRALRSHFMNYEESATFDKWARWTEIAACVPGFGGMAGTARLLWKGSTKAPWFFSLALISTITVEYTARGGRDKPYLYPSLASRSMRHVDAGALWAKIHRTTKLYRSELQEKDPETVDWNEQHDRYLQLLEDYERACKYTAIRQKVYDAYNNTEKVCKENDRRLKQTADYMKHEKDKLKQRADHLEHEEGKLKQRADHLMQEEGKLKQRADHLMQEEGKQGQCGTSS